MANTLKVGTTKEAIESLFHPGGTVDVMIERVNKRLVRFSYLNETYYLNGHGCIITKGLNGYYQHSSMESLEYARLVDALKEYLKPSREWMKNELVYNYTKKPDRL